VLDFWVVTQRSWDKEGTGHICLASSQEEAYGYHLFHQQWCAHTAGPQKGCYFAQPDFLAALPSHPFLHASQGARRNLAKTLLRKKGALALLKPLSLVLYQVKWVLCATLHRWLDAACAQVQLLDLGRVTRSWQLCISVDSYEINQQADFREGRGIAVQYLKDKIDVCVFSIRCKTILFLSNRFQHLR